MIFLRKGAKGFTLIEVLVVVAIIVILLGIILASITQARQSTREKKRVADLANIEFALTLYKEQQRDYPEFDSGIEIGNGDDLDEVIQQYSGNTYADPLDTGSYEYGYDSNFNCSESGQYVIYAREMELEKNANFDDVCTDPSAVSPGTNTYIKVLK